MAAQEAAEHRNAGREIQTSIQTPTPGVGWEYIFPFVFILQISYKKIVFKSPFLKNMEITGRLGDSAG